MNTGVVSLRALVFALTLLNIDAKAELQWEKVTPYNPYPYPPRMVVFGNDKLVGVSDYSLAYSADGLTWHQGKTFATNDPIYQVGFTALSFGGGVFVAGSAAGYVSTSSDGVSWAGQKIYPGAITHIAWGAGRFLVTGYAPQMLTSTNGITWEVVPNFDATGVSAIAYDGGQFLACFGLGNRFAQSTDGLTWTALPLQASFTVHSDCAPAQMRPINSILGMAFAGGKFALLTYAWDPGGGVNVMFSSVDGITWSDAQPTNLSSIHAVNGELQPLNVEYGAGVYIRASVPMQRGPDLQHMTDVPQITRMRVDSAAANGKTIVGVGMSEFVAQPAAGILLSTNGGLTFDSSFAIGTSPALTKVRFLNGKFVAVGNSGKISRSADGALWTDLQSGTSANLTDVAYGVGRWVVVGDQGIITSDDGVQFIPRDVGAIRFFGGVTYVNGRFIAGGDVDTVLVSTNGIDWQRATTPLVANGMGHVAFGNGLFVGGVSMSTDAMNWLQVATNFFRGNLDYADGLFFSDDMEPNTIAASADGVHWTVSQIDPAGAFRIRDVAVSDGTVWAFGNDSGIWRMVVNDVHARAVVDAGKIRLNIDVPKAGNYRVLRAAELGGPWTALDLLQIGARIDWTETVTAGSAFYIVKEE